MTCVTQCVPIIIEMAYNCLEQRKKMHHMLTQMETGLLQTNVDSNKRDIDGPQSLSNILFAEEYNTRLPLRTILLGLSEIDESAPTHTPIGEGTPLEPFDVSNFVNSFHNSIELKGRTWVTVCSNVKTTTVTTTSDMNNPQDYCSSTAL